MQLGRYRSDVRQRGGGRESGTGERAREEGGVHYYEVLGAEWTGRRNVHSQQSEEGALPLSLLIALGMFITTRARLPRTAWR